MYYIFFICVYSLLPMYVVLFLSCNISVCRERVSNSGRTQINHDYRIWVGWQPVSQEVEAGLLISLTQPPPIFPLFHVLHFLLYNSHILSWCDTQYEFLQSEDQTKNAP